MAKNSGRAIAAKRHLVGLATLVTALAPAGCSSTQDATGPGDAGNPADAASGWDGGPVVLAPLATKPGCTPHMSAVAHHVGGAPFVPQPANAPTSCVSSTLQPSLDSSMVLTAKGALLFAPAPLPGFSQSSDDGVTWKGPTVPPSAPAAPWLHPWLWRDAQSGRIFYNVFSCSAGVAAMCTPGSGACSDGSGAALWLSDDDGVTWEAHSAGCGSADFGQIFTGPAAIAADKQALVTNGYPDVVYYCATGPTPISGPNRLCYRSLDGGKTFTPTAGQPANVYTYPHDGAVGPDGTLYVTRTSSTGLAIAISKDEGDSWKLAFVPGSRFANGIRNQDETFLSSTVAVDDAGTVYAVWVDSTNLLLYLSLSADKGATWSEPQVVGAPGVRVVSYPNIVAKEAGHVAIAYYGSTHAKVNSGDGYYVADGRPYNAYMMESKNILVHDPVLWTVAVNDPATPVIDGMSVSQGEYIGTPVFAPDGSVWAAFADRGNGIAAHLTAPPASPASPASP